MTRRGVHMAVSLLDGVSAPTGTPRRAFPTGAGFVGNGLRAVPSHPTRNATEGVPYTTRNATEGVPYTTRNATEGVPYTTRNAAEGVPYSTANVPWQRRMRSIVSRTAPLPPGAAV